MKEKLCYIPTARGGPCSGENEYELPDGNTITLDQECRSTAAEVTTLLAVLPSRNHSCKECVVQLFTEEVGQGHCGSFPVHLVGRVPSGLLKWSPRVAYIIKTRRTPSANCSSIRWLSSVKVLGIEHNILKSNSSQTMHFTVKNSREDHRLLSIRCCGV